MASEVLAHKSVAVNVEPKEGESSLEEQSIDDQCMKYAEADPGFLEKGNLSNISTFVIMAVGIVMRFTMGKWEDNYAGQYILAFGLFGFAGGVTNWLAITMLFDEVPGLYGSGIIPKQFKQIKATLKTMIMDTFFAPAFLQKQLKEKLDKFADPGLIAEKLQALMDSPEFDSMLDRKLDGMKSSPMGLMLSMFNLNATKIKPFLKPFVSSIASDIGPLLSEMLNSEGAMPVIKIRNEVEKLMDERLKELTADRVKKLIEVVMRVHLGWLVVWGNIFGGLIGVISQAAGY
eukprot:CAMPEP_0196573410 /NCGR_PEP_ID=MMETSP1081-20130531/3315_1 /TAXON_ID=36882 /ORGANISM="Pyramimonas amylifera, Strain CCMP720" /LENGTH=288 /DNA_ID=CAMNT_0041891101 /DNA_START=47 /DNA_END=913 /DNA_ORIENTATION=+